MNIEEFADIINRDIIITRYACQDNRYSVSFENCETKENEYDACLTSAHGNGKSPDEAIENYVDKIRGKFLIFNAMGGEKRREFFVPKNITRRRNERLDKIKLDR